MSDSARNGQREPMAQKLARLGLKPGPPGRRPIQSRRRRFDEDENIFSKRPALIADTDKNK